MEPNFWKPSGAALIEVLQHLEEAVIILDPQRTLNYVNDAARRLLGYEEGRELGGRCRLTTRGVDCENACPLTFALEAGLDRVEDFSTIYHTGDGQPLPLRVTLIPLRSENGDFEGAVEILRPTEPEPGFFMVGRSQTTINLRQLAYAAARSRTDLAVMGEAVACRDVARAIHRFSGFPGDLFLDWTGTWEGVRSWPPGNVFADGEDSGSLLQSERPDGWRAIVGVRPGQATESSTQVLKLPSIEALENDLPCMIAAWIDQLSPGKTVSPEALERLVRVVCERGLGPLEEMLSVAITADGGRIEESHLPVDGYRTALVDEFLRAPNPLAALEEGLFREVLERCGWKIQNAADRLGISRVTMWRKMKDLGIEKDQSAPNRSL